MKSLHRTTMGKSGFLLSLMVLGVAIGSSMALQCLKCGLYNDGVGSITPCINSTYMELIDCPSKDHKYCIKYMSEGSIVRDCVADCTEKDNWSSRSFCCKEDGCNASPRGVESTPYLYFLGAVATLLSGSAISTYGAHTTH